MSANTPKKAVEGTLHPIKLAGRIVAKTMKEEVVEKITPTPPRGAPSLQRKILEEVLRDK